MIAKNASAGDGGEVQRRLRELIAALDRRVPHLERVDEVEIARAAAALRKDRRLIFIAFWEDGTPRLSVEPGLIDRHENVAHRLRGGRRVKRWLGDRESNPDSSVQSRLSYH